jgi:hypothetical protein
MTAEEAAEEFAALADAARHAGTLEAVPDNALRRVLTATIRLYAAKSEAAQAEVVPFAPEDVTPTEAVTLACGVIRGAGLNLFDVAMWFGRSAGGL